MSNLNKLLAEIELNSGYVPVTVAEVVRLARLVRAADEIADRDNTDDETAVFIRNYRKLREGGRT